MGVLITSLNGNPNIGLYGYATDSYVLLSTEFPKETVQKIEEALDVPAFQLSIAGTPLIGAFLNGNDECLLVPDIAFDSEIHLLKKFRINFKLIDTRFTCLGNNLLIGPRMAFANPEFSTREVLQISRELGIPVEQKSLVDVHTVGALGVFNGKKLLIHHDLSNREQKEIEAKMGVAVELGTLNMGNPYIKSGIINNKKGFIVGYASGGPEINNAEDALGYLKEV